MSNLRSDITFSMPCAMIQHLPFAEQIQTVKSLGFQEFTLHPFYLGVYVTQGLSVKDMKSMIDDNGLKISRIDPLTTWVPQWQAYNFGRDYNMLHAMDVSEFLDLSAFFECKYVSLNAMWKAGDYAEDQIVEFYRAICQRAATFGMDVDLEAIPMWGVPRLEDALRIIKKADVPNAGLVFDTTHFTRGGSPLSVLEEVPGDLIHVVQLCDGLVPGTMSLEEECFNRMWPGTGHFKIAEMIKTLDKIGGLRGVGPEVFSPDFAKNKTPGTWIAAQTQKALSHYPELLAH